MKLLKLATESLNNNETDVNVPLGWEEMREMMKESMMREWKRLWQNDTKGRRYFSFQPEETRLKHAD